MDIIDLWINNTFILLQRNSISPAEREKYRPRTSPEPDHKKVKKEDKDMGHVSIKVRIVNFFNYFNINLLLSSNITRILCYLIFGMGAYPDSIFLIIHTFIIVNRHIVISVINAKL